MSTSLRFVLIFLSLVSLLFIIKKIRNSKMQIEYSIFWIVFSMLMILVSIFPNIIYVLTNKLEIMSPANFVYLFIIIILLIKVFMITIEHSRLEKEFKDLVQQIAINEKLNLDKVEKQNSL